MGPRFPTSIYFAKEKKTENTQQPDAEDVQVQQCVYRVFTVCLT